MTSWIATIGAPGASGDNLRVTSREWDRCAVSRRGLRRPTKATFAPLKATFPPSEFAGATFAPFVRPRNRCLAQEYYLYRMESTDDWKDISEYHW